MDVGDVSVSISSPFVTSQMVILQNCVFHHILSECRASKRRMDFTGEFMTHCLKMLLMTFKDVVCLFLILSKSLLD